jgi:hypothetical protein
MFTTITDDEDSTDAYVAFHGLHRTFKGLAVTNCMYFPFSNEFKLPFCGELQRFKLIVPYFGISPPGLPNAGYKGLLVTGRFFSLHVFEAPGEKNKYGRAKLGVDREGYHEPCMYHALIIPPGLDWDKVSKNDFAVTLTWDDGEIDQVLVPFYDLEPDQEPVYSPVEWSDGEIDYLQFPISPA